MLEDEGMFLNYQPAIDKISKNIRIFSVCVTLGMNDKTLLLVPLQEHMNTLRSTIPLATIDLDN